MKQTTMTQTTSEAPTRTKALKALLICGIISTPLYITGHILAGMQLKGYSHIDQMVSELSAVGAPSQPVAGAFATVYDILVIAFGIGVWMAAGNKRSLRVAAIMMLVFAGTGLLGWLAPMNPRGAERSATDVAHQVYGYVQVLSMVLFVGFGSGAGGRGFRIYSILTVLAALAAGAWTGVEAARIAAGLPTPWGGAIERVAVYGPMLWMLVLAVILLRAQKGQEGTPETTSVKAVG